MGVLLRNDNVSYKTKDMETIKSVSDKRIIVPGTVNGREYYFLVDTGASIALISEKVRGLDIGKRFCGSIEGAGGSIKARICNTFVKIGGKDFSQFLATNLDNLIASIAEETNVEIAGIIALPQMKFYGVEIDTAEGTIKLKNS